MRTLTIRKGGEGSFHQGWNTAVIQKAEYGTYNGTRFIDVWFDGFPESLNMRIYEARNKEGEEFAVGQLFRFANAGIIEGLQGPDGNTIVKLSDEPDNLKGRPLNIYLYKEGQYSRVLKQPAPTVFDNAVDSFSEDDVVFWQKKAESYYHKFVLKNNTNGITTDLPLAAQGGPAEEVPF